MWLFRIGVQPSLTIRFSTVLTLFGRPFLKRFALCYRTVVCPVLSCLSCLSVTLYCGQTVGRIQMKLGVHGGLGPGHSVLDVDPGAPPQRGTAPNFRTTFVALPNGSMDQDATW